MKFDIRKIQLCEFEILNELDKVAKKHNVQYATRNVFLDNENNINELSVHKINSVDNNTANNDLNFFILHIPP